MTDLPLTFYPTPSLREPSKKVTVFNDELKKLAQEMGKAMKANKGIGLAAPQIGKNIQMTVIGTEDGLLVLVNPRIYYKSFRKEISEEGCLSIPEVFGQVKRSLGVTIRAQNVDGKKVTLRGKGLLARVIQHEIDHLRGILFIDRTKDLKGSGKLWDLVKKEKKIK
ncbi:peptide deformylase [bacterium]|nr:peptide deformylase [bacterium]|tara:strand:+ start:31 stop:528 length:498 start_codon:yes stop_codon:yes gene_type:complete